MFFTASDDDDGSGFSVGMPTSGSKLSSLFGMGAGSEGGNESLKYTAPKQPKPKGEETKTEQKGDAPSLLFACACHTFKYVNGQYTKQGKLGAAVLGHLASKDYKILLYISQKKPVTNAKIHSAFVYTVQKNNYVSFYDDQSQSWSLCFDTEDQLIEFSKWVCLARYNAQSNALVTQDLNITEGQEVQKGDTVEMQYTGWLHDGNAFGKVFDSNKDTGKLFKFKIGKGKVIKGWDTGVVGMKKGSKRMLIIPPELAYGAKAVGDRVPPNSTLIFQVEITRAKFVNPQADSDAISVVSLDTATKEETKPQSPSNPEVDVSDAESRQPLNTNDSLKERTKSISDQLSKTPENTKSKLLERMSKMGQSIIPTNPAPQKSPSPESVDGLEDQVTQPIPIERQRSNEHPQSSFKPDSPKPHLKPKPEPVPRPVQSSNPVTLQPDPAYAPQQQHYVPPNMFQPQMERNQMYLPQQQQLSLYQSPQAMQAAAMLGFAALPQQQMPQPQQPAAGASANEMNLMMTDSRLKHAELKTDLSRMMEKIDNMTLKLNIIENDNKHLQQLQPSSHQQQQQLVYNQAPEMEASILMQNITRIIKENEKLRSDCEEKNLKIEKLNERMTDLLTKNQSFFEKSNELLANQTDSMQNTAAQAMVKVSTLEQQNIKLETELSTLKTQLLQAESKQQVNAKREADLLVSVENLKQEVKQYKENADDDNTTNAEHEAVVADLKEKLKREKKEQKQVRLQLEQLDEEQSELRQERDSLNKALNDLKKKRKDDKTKHEEELEEAKTQHEDELKSLKQRYKKTAGTETEKLAKLEEELTNQLNTQKQKELKTLTAKHDEIVKELTAEKELLKEEVDTIQQKLTAQSKQVKLTDETKVDSEKFAQIKEENIGLLKEIESLKEMSANEDSTEILTNEIEVLKDSLSVLNDSNVKLKEESDVLKRKAKDLEQECDETKTTIENLKTKCDVAYDKGIQDGRENVKTISHASYQRGLEEGKNISEANESENNKVSEAEVTEKIKKVMNSVFFKLRSEFEADESYMGKQVVISILDTIKEVTLQITSKDEDESESEEEDESEEEESEKEEEEKEEEEEESEGEQEETKEEEKEKEKKITEEVTGTAEELTAEEKGTDEVDDENDKVDAPNESDEEQYATDEGESVNEMSSTPNEATVGESEVLSETDHNVGKAGRETKNEIDEDDKSDKKEDVEYSKQPTNMEEAVTDGGDNVEVNDTEPLEKVSNEKEAQSSDNAKDVEELGRNQKSVLEEVGLDSSLFGSTPELPDVLPEAESEVPTETPTVELPKKDESSLFFSSEETKTVEEKKGDGNEENEKKEKKEKPSLFDDDDDDDFFVKKTSSQKASAFSRSPPPLFEDDDDDTNWI